MPTTIAWVMLGLAGILDVLWAMALKYAEGYSRLGWSIVSVALLAALVILLGRCLLVLPLAPLMRCGPGSEQSVPRRSVSTCSQSRRRRCG